MRYEILRRFEDEGSGMNVAAYLHGARDMRLAATPVREGCSDEALIDVAAVGICGSDLHYYKDGGIGAALIREPFVPGHEFGGYLCEDLSELSLPTGTLVAIDPNRSCGVCEWCREGNGNLCPNVRFIGAPPFDGAMTQRLWVPKSQIVVLPESFAALEAAMLEPLGVAIHTVDLAKPKLREPVALLGAGPIGLLVLQTLKVAGAGDVLVIDPLEHRRAAAMRLGASDVFASADQYLSGVGKSGKPLVVEATNSPTGFSDAVLMARIGGRVILAGIPDGDHYSLAASQARRRALKIKFVRRMGDDYPRAIELVRTGRVDVVSVVSHRISLEETPSTFAALAEARAGYHKAMIYPSGLRDR
jgi:L-iditol 2-dehydrogenase